MSAKAVNRCSRFNRRFIPVININPYIRIKIDDRHSRTPGGFPKIAGEPPIFPNGAQLLIVGSSSPAAVKCLALCIIFRPRNK